MQTPWFMLYRAGSKLDNWLSANGLSIGSSRLIGGLYFLAICVFIGGLAVFLHMVAANSALDVYFQAHFDTILYVTLATFLAYMLARTFWDAFWDAGTSRQNTD